MVTGFWGYIAATVAIIVVIVIAALAAAIVKALFDGTINLRYLLAEPADPTAQRNAQEAGVGAPAPSEIPKASLSRFQFLIFTFVVAGVYLVLCLETGTFVNIPENAVLMLGVSGGTYAASKGIKAASDAAQTDATPADRKKDG